MTEQWINGGDCGKCRRANYCRKDCTARKKHKNDIVRQAYMDVMEEKNPGFKKIMEHLKLN